MKIIKNPIKGFDEDNCSQPITITPGKEFFNKRITAGDGPTKGVCDLLSQVFKKVETNSIRKQTPRILK